MSSVAFRRIPNQAPNPLRVTPQNKTEPNQAPQLVIKDETGEKSLVSIDTTDEVSIRQSLQAFDEPNIVDFVGDLDPENLPVQVSFEVDIASKKSVSVDLNQFSREGLLQALESAMAQLDPTDAKAFKATVAPILAVLKQDITQATTQPQPAPSIPAQISQAAKLQPNPNPSAPPMPVENAPALTLTNTTQPPSILPTRENLVQDFQNLAPLSPRSERSNEVFTIRAQAIINEVPSESETPPQPVSTSSPGSSPNPVADVLTTQSNPISAPPQENPNPVQPPTASVNEPTTEETTVSVKPAPPAPTELSESERAALQENIQSALNLDAEIAELRDLSADELMPALARKGLKNNPRAVKALLEQRGLKPPVLNQIAQLRINDQGELLAALTTLSRDALSNLNDNPEFLGDLVKVYNQMQTAFRDNKDPTRLERANFQLSRGISDFLETGDPLELQRSTSVGDFPKGFTALFIKETNALQVGQRIEFKQSADGFSDLGDLLGKMDMSIYFGADEAGNQYLLNAESLNSPEGRADIEQVAKFLKIEPTELLEALQVYLLKQTASTDNPDGPKMMDLSLPEARKAFVDGRKGVDMLQVRDALRSFKALDTDYKIVSTQVKGAGSIFNLGAGLSKKLSPLVKKLREPAPETDPYTPGRS